MKKSESKKGELVFMPSEITLLKFKDDDWSVTSAVDKWKITDRPSHVLIVDGCDVTYTKVLHDGECWMARKQDLYPVRDQDGC